MIASNILNTISSFFNPNTGQGMSGDHGSLGVSAFRTDLGVNEITELLRHSALLRIVCEAYGEDITRAWRSHLIQAQRWTDIEELYEFRDVVEKAVFYSEGFGGAYVIPRYAESIVTAAMLSAPRPVIRAGLLGFQVFNHYDLNASGRNTTKQPNGRAAFYTLKDLTNIEIHHSWFYPVRGPINLTSMMGLQTNSALLGQSRIDIIYDDYARMISAYGALSHILVKGNIDILKLVGLAERLSRCNDTAEMSKAVNEAMVQATLTVKGANSFQPVVLDSEETFERKGGNHTGASEIARELLGMFVAASRRPRTRLLGEQAKGLNNGGDADLETYYSLCATFRERRCTGLLNWLDGVAAPGVRTSWDFNPLREMSASQLVDVRLKEAELDQRHLALAVPGIEQAINDRVLNSGVYAVPQGQ